jgi:RHS repeat-associated protein
MKRLLQSAFVVLSIISMFRHNFAQEVRIDVERLTVDELRLSWSPSGFRLEQTTELSTNSVWTSVVTPAVIENGITRVTITTEAQHRFFRLGPDGTPDPASVASAAPLGVATVFGQATEFLYSGSNPIQTGVTTGTISSVRAAVLRGRVKNRDNTSIAGVTVSILGHPEFGQTKSRSDGMFDLAVNGGDDVIVTYDKAGLLPVQRQIGVPWRDYVSVDDVVMIPVDPIVTSIALGANSTAQLHQASLQTDDEGARKATLLFLPGTSAQFILADGTTQARDTINVRATEFTVGPNGPAAMPGVLPPSSAYTYCVELSADEAISAGAVTVEFTQPVINYVENFLKFPVGIDVPSGFYDRQKGVWIPSKNGRVIKVLSITEGLANVDTDGDNTADQGLAITTEEQRHLATLYTAGQSIWRVLIPHFSVVDHNWSFLPVDAATPASAGAGPVANAGLLEDPSTCEGCVIEMENQVLGESVPIVGTGYTLNYRSDRQPGRIDTRQFTISGPTVPASLKGIELHLNIGGRNFTHTFGPAANQQFTFVWDRQDSYGRTLYGGQPLVGSINYLYPVNYTTPNSELAFGRSGGAVLLETPGRAEFIISQPFSAMLGEGLTDARVVGLGGWTLDVHHFYDPNAKVLHSGHGGRRRTPSVIVEPVLPVALPGKGISVGLAAGPDGSVYYFAEEGSTLWRLLPDGTKKVVAGGARQQPGESPFGDDGPALAANLLYVEMMTVGPDGSIYIVSGNVVRRIGVDGIIRRFAGKYCNDCPSPGADGGLATETDLGNITSLAFGPDGSLYLATFASTFQGFVSQIRRIGGDGIVTTFAGTSRPCDPFGDGCGDGGPATQAQLSAANAIAVAPDGTVYIADANRIRRVRTDGTIETYAGSSNSGFSGEGVLAINAEFCNPATLTVTQDGSLYIADMGNGRIRRIGPDGIISTVAGRGISCNQPFSTEFAGDYGSALDAQIAEPRRVAASPDGTIYFTSYGVSDGRAGIALRRVRAAFGGFTATDIVIPSEDAGELYVFNQFGRHLSTVDSLTGGSLREFGYDSAGRLSQIIEKTGGTDNITTIDHDAGGKPTGIVAPLGQRTALAVDANGFLSSISNPATERIELTSNAGGLIASKTDSRGKINSFVFDPEGRLIRDTAPGESLHDIARSNGANEYTVTRTTALARTSTYKVESLAGNVERRTITAPDGTQSRKVENNDGATAQINLADGTAFAVARGPDPRFGFQSPVTTTFSVRFPSTLQLSVASARTAVLGNATDPLSLISLTETTTVDGRTAKTIYTAGTRSFVNTTPAGRAQTGTLDSLGRVVRSQLSGLEPVAITYENRGRVANLSVGSAPNIRSLSFTYTPQGDVDTVTDSSGRISRLTHDSAGRVTSKTLPDGRVVGFGYDSEGNLTSLTPPGRPAHTFGYSDRNELTLVTPPAVAGAGPTSYSYDRDGALTTITRAGEQIITFGYDSGGRPITRKVETPGEAAKTDSVNYDSAGRIATIVASSGVRLGYTYDGSLLNEESWAGPVVGKVTVTYDTSLRLATQLVNGGNTVAFTYDNDSLLTKAGDLVIVRNQLNGLPTSAALGVVASSISYNSFGEVTQYETKANEATVYSSSTSRDGLGRIAEKIETIGGVTDTYAYTYDLVGQLTAVSKNGVEIESYNYDPNGNRVNATINGASVAAVYDEQDRLMQHGETSFTYTPTGDLFTRTTAGQTTTYNYDALGNLLRVTLPNATAVAYVIDAQGRRVAKKVNQTVALQLLYGDGLRPVAELDGNGALVSRFVYGGRNVPAYMIKGGVAHRIITDQIGSVRLVVNSVTGAIVQRMDYDAFGNVTLDTEPGFQPFGFAGGIYDADTRLVRFGARDYDPEIGRWTAKDPIGFSGGDANLYRYVRNQPVNLVDYTGMGPDDFEDFLEEVTDSDITLERTTDPFERRLTQVFKRSDLDKEAAVRRLFRKLDKLVESDELLKGSKAPKPPTKINCGGFVSGLSTAFSLLDFVTVYQRAVDSGRTFFDELDILANDDIEEKQAAGVKTTVNFLGPFVYVSDIERF